MIFASDGVPSRFVSPTPPLDESSSLCTCIYTRPHSWRANQTAVLPARNLGGCKHFRSLLFVATIRQETNNDNIDLLPRASIGLIGPETGKSIVSFCQFSVASRPVLPPPHSCFGLPHAPGTPQLLTRWFLRWARIRCASKYLRTLRASSFPDFAFPVFVVSAWAFLNSIVKTETQEVSLCFACTLATSTEFSTCLNEWNQMDSILEISGA